ncbi:MAG: beta galactosidase jelly roll domain-containing protein [Melioribacteraceae bacterium]|nr:beta galactosidase jelly roll domain-containing protein [Melioribacteraceae bacterium]
MTFLSKFIRNVFILSALLHLMVLGQVKLPKLISDGLVLQRNTELKIWGWAAAGEKIEVQFIDSVYSAIAQSNGNWSIILPELHAGGPYDMTVSASNSIKVRDILIGDVWICSGQSNMELNMQRVSPLYEKEIASSENQFIRYFEVPDKFNFVAPQKDLPSGEWLKADPENVLKFSAVSYFFGKELYDRYKVPVGLVNAALGGSPIASWISEEGLKEFPEFYEEALKFKDSTLIQRIRNEDNARISEWYNRQSKNDEGYSNPEMPWYDPEYDATGWSVMQVPGYWANTSLGFTNGVVWYRKEIELPLSLAGKKANLNLGRIIDADSVFVNGVFVGTTSYQYPPRRYEIPEDVLKEGKNVLVVRVISNWGRGGFEVDKPYELVIGKERIDLKGEWKYKLGVKMEPLKGETFIRWKPLGLYNAMIAPLLNMSIKGVIWYQGESDAGRPEKYREMFPAMISDWRMNWGQGDFPFLFVQLPNFMSPRSEPSESNWAMTREVQLNTLSVTNTGMAVTIDIGEWNDIHPLNKKDVGKRLALAAYKIAYGEDDIVYSGPIYKSMKVEGNKIIISFSNTGSGLFIKNGNELKEFAICGDEKKFVWANAKIKDDKVIVWSDDIPNPVAVRYAWADNPEGANLFNREGLPASPFRTDDF